MLKDEHIFVLVAARQSDLAYICVRNRQLDSEDAAHSLFDGYYKGQFGYLGKTAWDTVSICVASKPSALFLALSAAGEIFSYSAGTHGSEQIPEVKADMRNLGVIDGYAYACGMRRQLYKRGAKEQWTAMHGPEPTKTDQGRVIGFEAIGGFSESEIYAVGWGGEIWIAKSGSWSQVESPTTMILTAIECADGNVYVAGRNGTLLRGRDSAWEVVDTGGISDDFWDLCWFNDRLYVSSLARIYEFHDDVLYPVSMGEDRPATCFKLSAADGILWSLGTDDFFSFDGVSWARIE